MNQLLSTILLAIALMSCAHEKQKIGPDYEQIKPLLGISQEQIDQFDAITEKYNAIRVETFAKARAGGKINRDALMAQMKHIFVQQGEELKAVLNEAQFHQYAEWLEHNIPGHVGLTKEMLAQVKAELALDDEKSKMIEAINEAFVESYIGAHDKYHGNAEAARKYWTEFDFHRQEAIKALLTAEEYAKFREITKDERFKGEHGKGE